MKRLSLLTIAALIFSLAVICGPLADAAPAEKNIILSTTTSTQDSGLLDVLIPIFEKKTGFFVNPSFRAL